MSKLKKIDKSFFEKKNVFFLLFKNLSINGNKNKKCKNGGDKVIQHISLSSKIKYYFVKFYKLIWIIL
jgi:hypothetical protein